MNVSRIRIANEGLNCIKSFLKIFYEVIEMNGVFQSTKGAKSKCILIAIKYITFHDHSLMKTKLKVK